MWIGNYHLCKEGHLNFTYTPFKKKHAVEMNFPLWTQGDDKSLFRLFSLGLSYVFKVDSCSVLREYRFLLMNPVLFKDWGRGFPPGLTIPLAPENLIVGLVLWTNSVGKHSNPGPLLSSSLVDWSRVGFDLKDPNFWQVQDVWLNHRNANRIIIQQSYTAPYWTVFTWKRKI